MSLVSDPSSVVTTAAYLLFYRRRSTGPLGGERFTQILEKYDKSSGVDSDGDGVSEDDGHVQSRTVRRPGHNRAALNSDSDDDEQPPLYGETPRDGLEDEGIEMSNDADDRQQSLSMIQAWSFDSLGGNGPNLLNGGDAASDIAQFDSSGEDGRDDQTFGDADTTMVSSNGDADTKGNGVISVPPPAASGGNGNGGAGSDGSDEVAEIHLEEKPN